jgi:hypothetical protein
MQSIFVTVELLYGTSGKRERKREPCPYKKKNEASQNPQTTKVYIFCIYPKNKEFHQQ